MRVAAGCGPRVSAQPLALLAVLALAAGVRGAFVVGFRDSIDADEAVGALMALHIAQAREFPLMTWGAHYAGALVSYIGAALFQIFEPSLSVFRLATLPLSLIGIAGVAAAAHRLWGGVAALIAAIWLALGPPLLLTFSTRAIGGYPELLCFGGLALFLASDLGQASSRRHRWASLGAVAGFGTYSYPLLLPLVAATFWVLRRHLGRLPVRAPLALAGGFLVGVSPLLAYNLLQPAASALRLAGRVLDISRAELASGDLATLAISKLGAYAAGVGGTVLRLFEQAPALLGLPFGVWLSAPLLVAVAGGWVLSASRSHNAGASSQLGFDLVRASVVATIVFLGLLRLDRPRHLVVLYPVVALALGVMLATVAARWRAAATTALAALLVSNMVSAVGAIPRGPSFPELRRWLDAEQVRHVYTDYHIAYPLTFLSGETIVASPAAGPVNVERYPAYTQEVAAAPRLAYVFIEGSEASAVFRREMGRRGEAMGSRAVGGFDGYLPTRPVQPAELALIRLFPVHAAAEVAR